MMQASKLAMQACGAMLRTIGQCRNGGGDIHLWGAAKLDSWSDQQDREGPVRTAACAVVVLPVSRRTERGALHARKAGNFRFIGSRCLQQRNSKAPSDSACLVLVGVCLALIANSLACSVPQTLWDACYLAHPA